MAGLEASRKLSVSYHAKANLNRKIQLAVKGKTRESLREDNGLLPPIHTLDAHLPLSLRIRPGKLPGVIFDGSPEFTKAVIRIHYKAGYFGRLHFLIDTPDADAVISGFKVLR